MEEHADEQARGRADETEQDVFTEHVVRHLPPVKAQHLQGGDLLLPLADVDVGEIVQHHKGQHRRGDNEHDDDVVHAAQHIVKGLDGGGGKADARGVGGGQQPRGQGVPGGFVGSAGLGQNGIEGALLAEGALIQALGNVNVAVDIVFAHAGDGDARLLVVLVAELQHVARLHPQHLGGLLRQDGALIGEGHRLAGGAHPEGIEALELFRVRGHQNVQIGLAPGNKAHARFQMHRQEVADQAFVREHRGDAPVGGIVALMLHRQGQVIVLQLGELDVHDVADGIPQAEASHQHGGAAGDADDRHKEPLFVAEQVADGDLVGKFQPPPQGLYVLQQDAFARRGRFGPHQFRRPIPQGAPQGAQGRQQHGGQNAARGHQHKGQVAAGPDGGQLVQHRIGVGDDPWQQGQEHRQAGGGPQHAGQGGIQQIFARDGAVGIAQGLQRADDAPVLVDHAGHGSGGHQGRHQEEEDGEHLGDGGHLFRVTAVENIAFVAFIPGEHVPFGIFNVVDAVLCVPDLQVGVGDLFVKLPAAVLIFLPAVVQFLSGVLQLLAAVLQLLPGQLQLIQAPAAVHIGVLHLFQPVLIVGTGVRQLPGTGGQGAAAAVDLTLARIQLGLLSV